jgi:hypothetical protein
MAGAVEQGNAAARAGQLSGWVSDDAAGQQIPGLNAVTLDPV